MYLTAQHVIAPRGTNTGINAFYYKHGTTWRVPPSDVPNQNPGQLVRDAIEVQPPGNRVRSYFDFVGPDGIAISAIEFQVAAFIKNARGTPLPWQGVNGPCLIRVGIEAALATRWRLELADLFRASVALYP